VLETEVEVNGGAVRILDFMPPRDESAELVRIVEGLRGETPLEMQLSARLGYGAMVPWIVVLDEGTVHAIGGPDALVLRSPAPLAVQDGDVRAAFTVAAGQRLAFVLSWHASHLPPSPPIDARAALERTVEFWRDWSGRAHIPGPYHEMVQRSLITLKALTFAPTGAIVAAPTTSIPEQLGGVRNWDYRYCWIRDATFTLYALIAAGYLDEARAWRDWLLRAAAGHPEQLQIMYGLRGERRLPELELPWLPGYAGSKPVRIGNAAADQFQLDVSGELIDCLGQAAAHDLPSSEDGWRLQRAVLETLERRWREPDEGIWEVRGPRRHFTHSKVMAWVAFDRAVKAVERARKPGPVERWRALRDQIHEEVCARGYDPSLRAFTQFYGSGSLDASLLMVPLVGFLPPGDERVLGTIAAVERELLHDGLVRRYRTEEAVDGLPPGEGVFLPCTFWLVDNLALVGRRDEACALFERLLGLANDVGLLAEQYDPDHRRMCGNFPQAFTHISLVNSACDLSPEEGPSSKRAK
jgi:GH15 family glucan-1,4-alpha-glucosidase